MNREHSGSGPFAGGFRPTGQAHSFAAGNTRSPGIDAKIDVRTDEAALGQPFVTGRLEVPGRAIPVVGTRLTLNDRRGGWKVRWGMGRNSYRVRPGIYALGAPRPESVVLVTANYKLSFDSLRKELSGIDAWILVLDTKGVNVWCAAGKGSFGTEELVSRIAKTGLRALVSHRRLILPQLGASGVSAHEIARRAGFSVIYGPVRAADIPAWMDAGMRKGEAMRTVRFGFVDRLLLVPVEFVHSWVFFAAVALIAVLAALLARLGAGVGSGGAAPDFFAVWATVFGILSGGVVAGTVGLPALLPLLPFRAFALKGAFLGALWGGATGVLAGANPGAALAAAAICGAVSAFLGMNFTGCSTFTSQTGARLEVEKGLVPMIVCAASGILFGGFALAFGF